MSEQQHRADGPAPEHALVGARVMDSAGGLIGHALRVLRDARTDSLAFVSVRDGVLSGRRHLIPLAGAEIGYERIDVPYPRSLVMSSPRLETGHRVLPEDEAAVCAHYGLPGPTPWIA